MNELQLFNYEDHKIRVVEKDGQPWWIAKDVCVALEMKQSAESSLRVLDEDEKGADTISTPGGPQQMLIVNESGMYHLIFNSRKPAAKKFRKWVTSEVLPSLRAKGSYELPGLSVEEVALKPVYFKYGKEKAEAFELSVLRLENATEREQIYKTHKALWNSIYIANAKHEALYAVNNDAKVVSSEECVMRS